MKRLLISMVFMIPLSIFSQDCDCGSTYRLLKITIEENEARVSNGVDKKSQ